jgi:hypothetical protein
MIRLAFLLAALSCSAAVTRIHVEDRNDYEQGNSFGTAGPYEYIKARVYYTVDPKLPANRIIADIAHAIQEPKGLVSFSADLYVIKPRDPAKGNGTILFEVSNRGGRGMLGIFQRDDKMLLEQGYTLVWVGWQWDVPAGQNLLRVYPPATKDIEAAIRGEFVPTKKVSLMNLGDRNMQGYAVDRDLKLTVRDSRDGKRQEIASGWKLAADKTHIEMETGFQPYQIYEATYVTKNPPAAGTGLAAIRDLISFLKYENNGIVLLGDQSRYLKRAIAFGTSQSGRLLRQFLYDGFNTDEKGRMVFDGVWANVAGGGRGSFNIRGAQPSRDGHPTFNFFYPSDLFPFTDLPQQDPVTKSIDGLLPNWKHAPKIFYTNGSYEYWGRSAALIHVTPDGKQDALLAPNTRIYYVASSQHGPGTMPPPKNGIVNHANANDYRPLYRALLAAMHSWISEDKQPPPSAYPLISTGTLVPFTAIKTTVTPKQPQRAWRVDYKTEPPIVGEVFPLLVPQTDTNGNELGGIRLPEIAAPLGMYAGWNYTADAAAPKGTVSDMIGSTIPFAPAKVKSLYAGKSAYQEKVEAEAKALAARRLLLERDIPAVVERAGKSWDWFTAPAGK